MKHLVGILVVGMVVLMSTDAFAGGRGSRSGCGCAPSTTIYYTPTRTVCTPYSYKVNSYSLVPSVSYETQYERQCRTECYIDNCGYRRYRTVTEVVPVRYRVTTWKRVKTGSRTIRGTSCYTIRY